MNYKDTLHMPKTEFPMRAGLSVKEPILVSKWEASKLYEKMNENRIDAPTFMLHDGPPYANGDMHCGHCLNRCLKDFIVRYKNMSGFKTPFIFGWDTHGLPIETKVTKSGVNRKTTPISEFRKKCEEYALTQVDRQKAQIKRMGCLGDYDHPYLTLLHEYEARQIDVFASMALKGLIFKGSKPVYWSWSSESALAEAEVEYADVEAKTCYIGFPFIDGKGVVDNDAKILIWTTTPWTIPSNRGVTLNPRFDYGMYQTSKGKLVFLNALKDRLVEELELEDVELIKTFKGSELEGAKAKHPLYDRVSLIMNASFVSEEGGTGCVHTDPDHGVDDFNACARYGIKPFGTVDEKGIMHIEEDPRVDGKFYEEANDIVIEELKENGSLLKEVDIVHSYPHDWRTHKPVIFRATPQWFCSIEPIRQDLLDQVSKIKWVPAWGETKMVNMIKDRVDWCISRQRAWGVPLPIIYNEDGTPIIDEKVFNHIRTIIAEKGSSAWFDLDPVELLPEGYTNPASPNNAFTKETDIMDVWFDSGSSWNGTLRERGEKYPADLYLEGNDQYRGWFNSSLILSTAVTGESSFKQCLTHGFVMDENWNKMSKSAGNGIDPNKIANEFGADILRLWAASVDYRADAKLSEGIIATVSDNYRKIRNTFKFMLGVIDSYSEENSYEFSLLDQYILATLESIKNKCLDAYDRYEFATVITLIMAFISADMSSFYLDYAKDILYCDGLNSSRRKAIVKVVYEVSVTIAKLLNPILPFTMEEIYSYLPIKDKKESIQLEDMVKRSHEFDESILASFDEFKKLRSVALKSLEEVRAKGLIGTPTQAVLDLKVSSKDLFDRLSKSNLSSIFMVSDVHLSLAEEDSCEVSLSEKAVCDRCRNYVDDLLDDGDGHICHRCKDAINE